MSRTRVLVGLLLVAGLCATGCSVLTPDDAVAAAEDQWAALTPEVQEALGLHDQDESATGNVAEIWVVRAELDLPTAGPAGAPAGDLARAAAERTARCLAVARALADTDLRAYGWLPVGDELLAAGPETCIRGLGGGWWAEGPPPSGPVGSHDRGGSLELGRADHGGPVEPVGVTLDLADLSVEASSDAPAWTSPVGRLDAQLFDQRLAALAAPLPADLVVADNQPRRLVLAVPAGTTVTVTATCPGTGPTSGHVAVETATSTTDLGPGILEPDQESDAAATCPGTATATLEPDDRVTTLAGPLDIIDVRVSGVAGKTSYLVQLR